MAADDRFRVPPPLRVSGLGMTTSTGFVIPAARSAIRNWFRFGVFRSICWRPCLFPRPPGARKKTGTSNVTEQMTLASHGWSCGQRQPTC